MKTCSTCKESKPFDAFYKRNDTPSGLSYVCKTCVGKKAKERNKRPEVKAARAKYSRDNRHIHREYERTIPKWKKRAKDSRRRASKAQRTPDWLTSKHLEDIENFYWLAKDLETITGEEYHVDHIVPLKGENISGLHVPWNLQVLSAKDNMSKGNRFDGR